jgi:hypothetical protein
LTVAVELQDGMASRPTAGHHTKTRAESGDGRLRSSWHVTVEPDGSKTSTFAFHQLDVPPATLRIMLIRPWLSN